jgi:hypothetical protein
METQTTDDRADAALDTLRTQVQIYREMSAGEKLETVFGAYRMGRELALAGLRMRHPEAGEDELWWLWARQHLGHELFEAAYGESA